MGRVTSQGRPNHFLEVTSHKPHDAESSREVITRYVSKAPSCLCYGNRASTFFTGRSCPVKGARTRDYAVPKGVTGGHTTREAWWNVCELDLDLLPVERPISNQVCQPRGQFSIESRNNVPWFAMWFCHKIFLIFKNLSFKIAILFKIIEVAAMAKRNYAKI